MRHYLLLFLGISLLTLIIHLPSCGDGDQEEAPAVEQADIVVFNASIFTSDDTKPEAEALAVKEGRFVYVGNNPGVTPYIGTATRVIDATDKMIVPGFIDNHAHVLWIGGLMGIMAMIQAANSMDDIKTMIAQQAAALPNLPFVIGLGFRYEYLPVGQPDAALADTIYRDKPLFLWSYGGNSGWVNTAALNLMQERNPTAFNLLTSVKDANGNPTGFFSSFINFSIFDYFSLEEMGEGTYELMLGAIKKALDYGLKVGVNTQSDIHLPRSYRSMVTRYQESGELRKARLVLSEYYHQFSLNDEPTFMADLQSWKEFGESYNDEYFYAGNAIKLYIDGVFQTYTAFLKEPYEGQSNNFGVPLWSQEDFNRAVQIADSMQLQVRTHATGDAGIGRVINAYINASEQNGVWDSRHACEHCYLPAFEDHARMASYNIYASMQPQHFIMDPPGEAGLGIDRLNRLMPWKSMDDVGVQISFGSDFCAGPMNPIYGIIIAALRINYKLEMNWGPQEAVDVPDSIRYFTIGSARVNKLDDVLGSITVGKYADFSIFSFNLLNVASDEQFLSELENALELIRNMGVQNSLMIQSAAPVDFIISELDSLVEMTVVGGNIVYQKKVDTHAD